MLANLPFVTSSDAYDIPPVSHILTGMTNKAYLWSYHDVADFLREHEFDFMEGLDGSKGAWVKLKENGEPEVMLDFKFTPSRGGARRKASTNRSATESSRCAVKRDVNTKEIIKNSDLIIAEVSFPATGQGIEIGWADIFGVPILCVSKEGQKISGSLKYITDKFITYSDSQDFITKLSEFLSK